MRNYSGSVKDLISTSLFCRRLHTACPDTCAATYYATVRNVFHAGRTCSACLPLQRSGNADAHVDEAIGGAEPYTRSRSSRLGFSAKGAAAKDMPAAIPAHPGRAIRRSSIVIVVPAILDPVIDV